MIYAKMYLDENEKREKFIVFDSVKSNDNYHCLPAGEFIDSDGDKVYRSRTIINPVNSMIASQEAIDAFLTMLSPKNDNLKIRPFDGDFRIFRSSSVVTNISSTIFEFKPDKGEQTKKTLKITDILTICADNGFDSTVLKHIPIIENELVKNLDLSKPVPEPENMQQQKQQ